MNKLDLPMRRFRDDDVLAGRLNGKRAFVTALESFPVLKEPTLVFLDFTGVALATSSYLSEVLLPLRDHLRLRDRPGYVILANLSDSVNEEIEEMLRRSGEALLACKTDGGTQIRDLHLCGTLDEKLHETFNLVSRKGETTAAQLYEEFRAIDSVGATAWNNRLASLTAKSLVVEILHGRTKKYRAVLGGA